MIFSQFLQHKKQTHKTMPTTSTTKVTFNATVQIRETLSLDDYTASEISAAWFNDDETEDHTKMLQDSKQIREWEPKQSQVLHARP